MVHVCDKGMSHKPCITHHLTLLIYTIFGAFSSYSVESTKHIERELRLSNQVIDFILWECSPQALWANGGQRVESIMPLYSFNRKVHNISQSQTTEGFNGGGRTRNSSHPNPTPHLLPYLQRRHTGTHHPGSEAATTSTPSRRPNPHIVQNLEARQSPPSFSQSDFLRDRVGF